MANSFKNVCEIIPDWANEGLEKNLEEAVYEPKKKKRKEETETKSVP